MSDEKKRDCYNCTRTEDRWLCLTCSRLYRFLPNGRMVSLSTHPWPIPAFPSIPGALT